MAVDQAGHPARPVDRSRPSSRSGTRPNGDGSYTVALFNLAGSAATVSANWADVGFTGSSATVHDDWSHTDLGSFATGYSVSLPAHGDGAAEGHADRRRHLQRPVLQHRQRRTAA